MKLYRKIRQELITGGKIKRYIPYAIGEIFLVMIGISLAFQLNNWNDNRIRQNSEIRYYKNIVNQIVEDKILVEEQKQFNNYYLVLFKYANKILETNDRSRKDTLGLIIKNLTQYSDFDRQGNIYETMVNSGHIKYLNNLNIINSIRDLEEKYIYINRMENIHYDAIMSHAVKSLSRVIKFSNANIEKPEEVYSFEFQNLIVSLIQVMNEKNKVYNEAIQAIDLTTILIHDVLESR